MYKKASIHSLDSREGVPHEKHGRLGTIKPEREEIHLVRFGLLCRVARDREREPIGAFQSGSSSDRSALFLVLSNRAGERRDASMRQKEGRLGILVDRQQDLKLRQTHHRLRRH